MKFYNTYIYTVAKMVSTVVGAVVIALMAVACGGDAEGETIRSEAYLKNTEVNGENINCAVVLRAQQGRSYSITVSSVGNWASLSGAKTYIEGKMEGSDKAIFIYFAKNASGESRTAQVVVSFSDGKSFDLSFTQHSYDPSVAFQREWPELPVCKAEDNYIFNTYFGEMGGRSRARNYTYCFDPDYRASLWVAYPLHSCYTTGSANRNNSKFGYDPNVDTKYQANLGIGSYSGWDYDRGHQLPAADRKCSQQMMDQTFYATNMTPQQSNFNQNKWANLEGKVRNWICKDTLYVVTGAYFGGTHNSSIDTQTTDRSGNICPTPTYYYKALLRTSKGNTGKRIAQITDASQLRAIVFWMEHKDTGDDTNFTAADCITVAELEERTGFTFFPMIDDSIEESVKQKKVPLEWGIYQ